MQDAGRGPDTVSVTQDMRSVALTEKLAFERSLRSSTGNLRPFRQIESLTTQLAAESTPLVQHRPAHRLTGCDRLVNTGHLSVC